MEKEFVKYEEALALKELGFDEPCFGYYVQKNKWVPASYSEEGTQYPSNSDLLLDWISAPLYQQVFRWFRGKGWNVSLMINEVAESFVGEFIFDIWYNKDLWEQSNKFNSYEEAELACLRKLIELVKNK